VKKAPKKPKGKTLLKKTSGDDPYLDIGSFLMGKDLIGGLSGSEEDSFVDYLRGKGISRGKADYMDYNSVNSHYQRFKGKMN
jgi:hypothetical protein